VAHLPAALPMRTPLPMIESGRSARVGSLKGEPHRPANVARVGLGKVVNARLREAAAARWKKKRYWAGKFRPKRASNFFFYYCFPIFLCHFPISSLNSNWSSSFSNNMLNIKLQNARYKSIFVYLFLYLVQ
jgi:hypothetical protein